VSGEVTGEAFTIGRPSGQYQGPAEFQRYRRRLYKLANRLEKQLGRPQDIEWAIGGDKLFVLQSRPITTLIGYKPATGEWNDSLTGDYLWSNVNFGEAVTEVMTPLSWTVLHREHWRSPLPQYQPFRFGLSRHRKESPGSARDLGRHVVHASSGRNENSADSVVQMVSAVHPPCPDTNTQEGVERGERPAGILGFQSGMVQQDATEVPAGWDKSRALRTMASGDSAPCHQ
jgi:hypothetical protein